MARNINKPVQKLSEAINVENVLPVEQNLQVSNGQTQAPALPEASVIKATTTEATQANPIQNPQMANTASAQTGQEQQTIQESVPPAMPIQPAINEIQESANTTKPVQFEYFAERHAQVEEKLKAMLELNKKQYVNKIMAENNLYAHKAYAEAWKLLVKAQNSQQVPMLVEDAVKNLEIPFENKAYVAEKMQTFVNACVNNIPQCLAEYVAPVIGEKEISINKINDIVNDPLRDYKAKQFTPSAENSLQLKQYLQLQTKLQIDAGRNINSIQLFTHATMNNIVENFNTSKKGEGTDFNYSLQYLRHFSSELGEKNTTILINNLSKTVNSKSLQRCLRLTQYGVPTEKILTIEYAKLTNEFNTLKQERGNTALSAFGISYTIPESLTGVETLQHVVLQEITPYWYSFYSEEQEIEKLDQIKFEELAILMQYVYTSFTQEERKNVKGVPHDRIRTLTQEAIAATFGKEYELYSVNPNETAKKLDFYNQRIVSPNPEKMIDDVVERGSDFIKSQTNSGTFYTIPTDQVAVLTNIDGQYIAPEKIGRALTVIKNNMDYSQFTVKNETNTRNKPLSAKDCELFANKNNKTYYLLSENKQIEYNGEPVVFTAQEVATLSNSIDTIIPAILQIKQAKTVEEAQQALKEVKNWQMTAKFLTSTGNSTGLHALLLYEALGHDYESFEGYNTPVQKEIKLQLKKLLETAEKNDFFLY